MKEVPLDESDIKSCQEFVAKAMEMDRLDLLFIFMKRNKTESFGIQTDVYSCFIYVYFSS